MSLFLQYFFLLVNLNLALRTEIFDWAGIVNTTRQRSSLYVLVRCFGLDPAQNIIVVYSVL